MSEYSYSKTNTLHLIYRDPAAPEVRFNSDTPLGDQLSWKHYTCPYNTSLPTAEFANDLGDFITVWNNYVNDPENKRSLRFAREVKPFDLIFIQRVKPANHGLLVLLPPMKEAAYNAFLENPQSAASGMKFKKFKLFGKFPAVSCSDTGDWDEDIVRNIIMNQ